MKSEGFWMAVLGSKAVGATAGAGADGEDEKLSCGSCGDCEGVEAVDFLPVKTSQLRTG